MGHHINPVMHKRRQRRLTREERKALDERLAYLDKYAVRADGKTKCPGCERLVNVDTHQCVSK